MKRIELIITPILENENAREELIYSLLCECERLFGDWMYSQGFDFTDVRNYSFKNCKITYFGELMELIFGEFKFKKDFFPHMKISVQIFQPIMRHAYQDKKLVYFGECFKKRFVVKSCSKENNL